MIKRALRKIRNKLAFRTDISELKKRGLNFG